MAVKSKIAPENVHLLLNELRKLPKKDTGYTREEAVAYLREEILAAARKGYSLQELRVMFREHGVSVALTPVLEDLGAKGKQHRRKALGKTGLSEAENGAAMTDTNQGVAGGEQQAQQQQARLLTDKNQGEQGKN